MAVVEFQSPSEWADHIERNNHDRIYYREFHHGSKGSWGGPDDFETTKKKLRTGCTRNVQMAEEMVGKINAEIEVPERTYSPSPTGGYPVVADYLAGSPTPMRCVEVEENESTPIRIFIAIGCSASVSAKDMARRGAAALALAMSLQRHRPVELWAYNDWREGRNGRRDTTHLKVKLGTTPVSIAHACHVLSNPGILRKLGFCLLTEEAGHNPGLITAPHSHPLKPLDKVSPTHPYIKELREALGATQDDLILGREYSATGMIFKNPVDWVQEEVNRHLIRKEENV